MSWLLDTNVLSELRKGARANPAILRWLASVDADDLWTSVLVVGEIRKGVELVRARDRRQASSLDRWLSELRKAHEDRLLPVTERIAETWGRMSAARPVSVVDGLLAATAVTHDLTLVTRNTRNVAGTGARVLDPFAD